MKINSFKKFLATGEMPREADVLDEAIAKYERETSDISLEDHDKRFHPGGYKEGDHCKFREAMAKGDSADKLSTAEEEELEIRPCGQSFWGLYRPCDVYPCYKSDNLDYVKMVKNAVIKGEIDPDLIK